MTTKLRPGSPKEVGMLPERVAYARDLCARWVKEGHTPALSVCVARRGKIVLHDAWGVLGPQAGAPPLGLDSIFPIASITKPITATLVMQLVEDGLLGLNRPVVDYLPEVTGAGVEEILVHHLLTHTSGYSWSFYGGSMMLRAATKLAAGFEPPPCPAWRHPENHRSLSLFWDAPREAAAGEVMIYSNHNYLLLGEIVTRLTERRLEELARERIFAPLGMDSSDYVVQASTAHRVVRRPSGFPMADPLPPGTLWYGIDSPIHHATPDPGYGAFSTAYDMTVFGQMILNRGRYGDARILSPAAVAAMTRDQIPGIKARFYGKLVTHGSWGYGWAVESPSKWSYFHGSLGPLGALGHPGAGGAMFWIDPAHELTGTYFEVTTHLTERLEPHWNFDLFTNVITAAVDD
jgi:CubicO group peptidase (beta-lactamase class C family)